MHSETEKVIAFLSALTLNMYVLEMMVPIGNNTFIASFLNKNPIYIIVLLLGTFIYVDATHDILDDFFDVLFRILKFLLVPFKVISSNILDDGFKEWKTPKKDMRDKYELSKKNNIRIKEHENGKMKIVETSQGEKEIYIRENE